MMNYNVSFTVVIDSVPGDNAGDAIDAMQRYTREALIEQGYPAYDIRFFNSDAEER